MLIYKYLKLAHNLKHENDKLLVTQPPTSQTLSTDNLELAHLTPN